MPIPQHEDNDAIGASRSSKSRRSMKWRKIRFIVFILVVCLWTLVPGIRAIRLVANVPRHNSQSQVPANVPLQEVHFSASDGVRLAGWLAIASPHVPTIILVPGTRGTHSDMFPWAQFLYQDGYNIFLIDDRGTGQSDGWAITLGAKEPDDVLGAVQYLKSREDLPVRSYGALGVSQGAGVVILAAAREPAITAIVADSAWVDQSKQIARMNSLHVIGPLSLPVLPYELLLTDAFISSSLQNVRPIDAIARLKSCAVLLIHSVDDQNNLTPLSGEQQLFAKVNGPKTQWIVPHGGHVGAIRAYPDAYRQHVLAFFSIYVPLR